MKKIIITVLLLGALLIPPLVLAQEQAQPYSSQAQPYSIFGRFIDNVKMFFSFGNKKVMLALDIRKKEINSAIINTKNGDDEKTKKNLDRAKKRLRFIQKKVSKDIAEDVKTNIDETINKIKIEKDLPDSFQTYVLEEEKTQLIAELVIEVEGKEGQTLTREMVKDAESGKKEVKIVVEGSGGQTKVVEIEGKIEKIDNQLKKRTFAEKTEGAGESGVIIEGDKKKIETGNETGDDGLTNEIKTDVDGDDGLVDDFIDKSKKGGIVGDTGTTVGPVTNKIDGGVGTNQIDSPAVEGNNLKNSSNSVFEKGTSIVEKGTNVVNKEANVVEKGINVVDKGTNMVESGMDIDKDKKDPNATPKTPLPTDGSICCKKTKYGETRYHWDSEEDCLNLVNIKGEVMDSNVCVALGAEVLDEEDPKSWGLVDGGVPEACVEQGAYDDEACNKIMEKVKICCKKTKNGEIIYGWDPGNICISPYGERVNENLCLNL